MKRTRHSPRNTCAGRHRRRRLGRGPDPINGIDDLLARAHGVARVGGDGDVARGGGGGEGGDGGGGGGGGGVGGAEEFLRGGRELGGEVGAAVVLFHEGDGPVAEVDGGAFCGLHEGFAFLWGLSVVGLHGLMRGTYIEFLWRWTLLGPLRHALLDHILEDLGECLALR